MLYDVYARGRRLVTHLVASIRTACANARDYEASLIRCSTTRVDTSLTQLEPDADTESACSRRTARSARCCGGRSKDEEL